MRDYHRMASRALGASGVRIVAGHVVTNSLTLPVIFSFPVFFSRPPSRRSYRHFAKKNHFVLDSFSKPLEKQSRVRPLMRL